jgi:hypothetical protein
VRSSPRSTPASRAFWFDVGQSGDEDTKRLTVDLAQDDLEEMLRLATGDEVALALDAGPSTPSSSPTSRRTGSAAR